VARSRLVQQSRSAKWKRSMVVMATKHSPLPKLAMSMVV